jgi:putative FmdB family regulatory protein
LPIYAYRCANCGFEKDVLQKISDPALTECPSCHANALQKQVTAAGFQLKGSGWYATDFKNPPPAAKAPASNDGKDAGKSASGDAAAGSKEGSGGSKDGSSGSGNSDAPAPAPAAAKSEAAAPASGSTKSAE